MEGDQLKVVYAGPSWLGSCARSVREALARRSDILLDEINEDGWFIAPQGRLLRAVQRLTRPRLVREYEEAIAQKISQYSPDIFLVYKGTYISASLINNMKRRGIYCVNIYPDCSPHGHGEAHKQAVGEYDLVISTKIYHPPLWRETYGYGNDCVFIPQGYDPLLHLVEDRMQSADFDLIMVARYRKEYGALVTDLAHQLDDPGIKVAIGGRGWEAIRAKLPSHWVLAGELSGRSYVSLLRRGKICVAPLTRTMVIDGQVQLGDVDTTRSYELAAAHCFFIHRRTDFATQLYDPKEVPMFDDAAELADLVRHYLAHPAERERMASAAHRRAVPAYSLDARAEEIVALLRSRVSTSGKRKLNGAAADGAVAAAQAVVRKPR